MSIQEEADKFWDEQVEKCRQDLDSHLDWYFFNTMTDPHIMAEALHLVADGWEEVGSQMLADEEEEAEIDEAFDNIIEFNRDDDGQTND